MKQTNNVLCSTFYGRYILNYLYVCWHGEAKGEYAGSYPSIGTNDTSVLNVQNSAQQFPFFNPYSTNGDIIAYDTHD